MSARLMIMSPLEWQASLGNNPAGKVGDTGPRDKGKPGGLTKPAGNGKISDRYAEDPSAFGVVKNWTDGLSTVPKKNRTDPRNLPAMPEFNPKTGEVYNSWSNKFVPPRVLKIMPRPGWHRLFTNYDGTPIISGKSSTYPKQPDHPYYHMLILHGTGEDPRPLPIKIDPLRVELMNLVYGTSNLNKIPYNS